jgi:hemerythrin superfamily protein
VDALTLLTEQHEEVDSLVEILEGDGEKSDKQDAFRELSNKLAAHATIEEKIFYPAVMAKQTEDMLRESVEEHLSMKRVLADMLEIDLDDEQFDAKLSVLKEQLEHHAHEEEEDKLFPKVRKLFSAEELEGLGNDMVAMFETLLEGEPSKNVPAETGEAAPLP